MGIDKEKLLEAFSEEREIYEEDTEFDKGVRYIVDKYTAVINLHAFDLPPNKYKQALEKIADRIPQNSAWMTEEVRIARKALSGSED